MLPLLRRLVGRAAGAAPPPPPLPPPAPEVPLAVVGDVHGCADLLDRMLERLASDLPGHRTVVVGDVVDRGERSREVLERLSGQPGITVLMGNHELMLLDFLDRPETGGRWIRNGGLQTLASFGLGSGLGAGSVEAGRLRGTRDALAEAMGPGLIGWLRGLPGSVVSGTVAVVHAGADPTRPVGDQPAETLAWGHPAFNRTPRPDGMWIAHGHVVVTRPTASGGRIAVDTGAYATGRLTAALIGTDGSVDFHEERA